MLLKLIYSIDINLILIVQKMLYYNIRACMVCSKYNLNFG